MNNEIRDNLAPMKLRTAIEVLQRFGREGAGQAVFLFKTMPLYTDCDRERFMRELELRMEYLKNDI